MAKPTNVELPTKAVENLPPKAAEKLPDIVAPAPEVHHEMWDSEAGTLFFDADTLDFYTLAGAPYSGVEPEFVVIPVAGTNTAALIEQGDASVNPNDGFLRPEGLFSTIGLVEETGSVTYHTDAGVDVAMNNLVLESNGIASFDWWLV
jgi:hypothetical protein